MSGIENMAESLVKQKRKKDGQRPRKAKEKKKIRPKA